ncbi:unnamed protein product, partial [Enterobius vermicularis]|uniref:CEP209_CC5 domain-containing protein n=1 Tax=Enterobius vermicularis TaxID=51028 RepID=A0A0N4V4N3_ENTVE
SKKAAEGEQSLVELLEERLAEAESCIQDYQDENTVLKCELRDIQEFGTVLVEGTEVSRLAERLKASESLCEELVEENEVLKADIKDLQQEIEEMQDQYREEEIDEFRELQRELEQNAKNCRILQFKLRKSERLKEQLDTEKQHLEAKVKDLLQASSQNLSDENQSSGKPSDSIRIKELESELRIAKEVSVRLHNELENAEERRYKLEDEAFYLKEKVRELQTQNKWREARNRVEQQTKRSSTEVTVPLNAGDVGKEMRDVLERESDLRDQLKFAEEDLKRTRLRIQDLENENEELLRKLTRLSSSKRPPMTRSVRIQELETDSKKPYREGIDVAALNKLPVFIDLTPEVQRDISAMIATITDLEHKNMELSMQVKRLREHNSGTSEGEKNEKVGENEAIDISKLESEKKVASLNKQIETLNNQLIMANERYLEMHQKLITQYGEDVKYVDALKEKCEELEKQLSEEKANGSLEGLRRNSNTPATTDEIEQCCEVLASVETQTNRICKQIEKIDNAQKDERRRSLSKDSSAAIIAELSTVMSELKNVHNLLESHKINNPSYVRKSPVKEANNKPNETTVCARCKENEAYIESQREEIVFYKKKNKDLTNQVLQTEDRWTLEIDKQRQIYENELKNLRTMLANAEKCVEEQNQLIESRTIALTEKTRMIQERDEKCEKLKSELQDLKSEIQAIVTEQKSAKEFEIKYKKLESLYESQVEKFGQERTKTKNEIAALKKRSDDTILDLGLLFIPSELQIAPNDCQKLREAHSRKEKLWSEEKATLEEENNKLRKQIGDNISNKGEPIYATISTIRFDPDGVSEKAMNSNTSLNRSINEKVSNVEKMNADLAAELEKLKLEKEDLQAELSKVKQDWTKEKEGLQHKVRQDEKVRSVEFDALQQKFASRMRIMEDTNKSLHTQLVQARRERDYNREALCTYERKINEEKQRMEKEEKRQSDLSQKCVEMRRQITQMEEEINRLKAELTLNKQAHLADQALWEVEKSHFQKKKDTDSAVGSTTNVTKNSKITESALQAAEAVQKQYADYQKFYTKEIDRLNARIRELSNTLSTKQHESQRTSRELREQIKVLEISQRNLLQARDLQMGAKEILEAEIEKLREKVHLSEVQRLTRKYKLTSIVDQLQTMVEPSYKVGKLDAVEADMLKYVLSQLKTIKDEDNHSAHLKPYQMQTYSHTEALCAERKLAQENFDSLIIPSDFFKTRFKTSELQYKHQIHVIIGFLISDSYGAQPSTSSTADNVSAVDGDGNGTFDATSQSSVSLRSYQNTAPTYKWLSVASALAQDGVTGRDSNSNDKDKTVEYDKDGRLHYIPKTISRFGSHDNKKHFEISHEKDSSADSSNPEPKSNSKGTNILHKIRREELAKGGQPSVRLMAKAFDSIEATVSKHNSSKRSIFSIRKSRSVENAEGSKNANPTTKSKTVLIPGTSTPTTVTVLGRNTSLSQIEELMGSQSPYAHTTLPRGSRNPLKNIGIFSVIGALGTRIVERVRRSLSRSSVGRSSTGHNTDNESVTGSNIVSENDKSVKSYKTVEMRPSSAPEKVKEPSTVAKTKARKKVKKTTTTNLVDVGNNSATIKAKG